MKIKKSQLSQLQINSEKSNFWDDAQNAQRIMKQISTLKELVDEIEHTDQEINNLTEFNELLENNPDEQMELELKNNSDVLSQRLSKLELQAYLSGKYDDHDAILSIHAGQGGTEAMDWASMLQRMYQRYFEKKNWNFELIDYAPGDEVGIKSAYFKVKGNKVYGFLRREVGVHRLVRLSPFNADNLRQTSFAKVEVTPVFENDADITIKPEDIEFAAYRSGGHGGQNVNKVSTAVRLTHYPYRYRCFLSESEISGSKSARGHGYALCQIMGHRTGKKKFRTERS